MSNITAAQIHEEVTRLSARIEDLAGEVLARGAHLAEAEHEWKKAEAKLIVSSKAASKGAAQAIVDFPHLHLNYLTEKYGMEAAIKALRAAEQQLSAAQTVASSHRAEANLVGYAKR